MSKEIPATKLRKQRRINRSISFTAETFAYIAKLAEEQNRSFNWIVNDLIAKHGAKVK